MFTDGQRPVALNFASAHNPGGGFRSGARAQEESLARASGLYACLEGREMYRFHESPRDPLYSSWLIYSPEVPVFRGDDGDLLSEPWPCAFITAAAPNAGVALEREPHRRGEVSAALRERVDRVLAAAALHGHDSIVLGAWGCGVFKNSAEEVAQLFGRALSGPFAGCFARVAFAVLDWSEERRFIGPFEAAFGRGTPLPLANEEQEKLAVSLFRLDLSPEEYAARHAHEFVMFSFGRWSYRTPGMTEWVQQLDAFFFAPGLAKRLRALRERYLSPAEIEAVEAREREPL
jgi:uncharacterized protein (TIGR02452 family)